jgi:hypothetical protein
MRVELNKNWRPKDWSIRMKRILDESARTFSPSKGYSSSSESIIEKTASEIIDAMIEEARNGKNEQ